MLDNCSSNKGSNPTGRIILRDRWILLVASGLTGHHLEEADRMALGKQPPTGRSRHCKIKPTRRFHDSTWQQQEGRRIPCKDSMSCWKRRLKTRRAYAPTASPSWRRKEEAASASGHPQSLPSNITNITNSNTTAVNPKQTKFNSKAISVRCATQNRI